MSVVTLATLSQYVVLIVEFYDVTVLRGVGEGLSQASFMFCLIYKLSSNLDKHSQPRYCYYCCILCIQLSLIRGTSFFISSMVGVEVCVSRI